MSDRFRKLKSIGFGLAKIRPDILTDLIDALPSKYRKSLIEGLNQFERVHKMIYNRKQLLKKIKLEEKKNGKEIER